MPVGRHLARLPPAAGTVRPLDEVSRGNRAAVVSGRDGPLQRALRGRLGRSAAAALADKPGAAAERSGRLGPLVRAAAPLLALTARLRDTPQVLDIEGLRRRIEADLRDFEARALAEGATVELALPARYALAATIDDLVLATPWGAGSAWAERGMMTIFFGEQPGAGRFFEVLAALVRAPAQPADLLALMYLCLALGMEGGYRAQPNGAAELARIRSHLYSRLRRGSGEVREPLALHWRGAVTGIRRRRPLVPLWVMLAGAVAVTVGLYQAASHALNRESDRVFAALQDAIPAEPAEILRLTPLPAPPLPPAHAPDQAEVLRAALADDVAAGEVEIAEGEAGAVVRIVRRNLFSSGASTIDPAAGPLVERIAAAIDGVPGRIVVAGHTDNVPIANLRFPSNWHLSQARAEAVVAALAPFMTDPARLVAEGRADVEPLADNDTAEGRERNRRIELLLEGGP